jgi:hypothetical protein
VATWRAPASTLLPFSRNWRVNCAGVHACMHCCC